MHKIRQILLFLDRGVSQRSIEKELKISRKTIGVYLQKVRETGFGLSELLKLQDEQLEQTLGLIKSIAIQDADPRKVHFHSLIEYFNKELSRTGVTRLLLWQEYIHDYPSGFQYSRFCELLQEQFKVNNAVMHFEHHPAKLMEVDFAGDPLVQVVKALNNALDFFGGVPLSVKSDNMKQWVTKSCKYEPVFTEMLEQWSNHNNIALLAARPYKPKDKPSVENNVKITYRRVYALLRNDTFHSIPALNAAIREKIDKHHQLNFQKKIFSRQELFDSQERDLLQSLPESAYDIRHYTRAKVQKNYHIVVGEDWHFYSVPYRYIGKEVNIAYSADVVEIYYDNQRIAVHGRNYTNHGITTVQEHMPEKHQAIARQRGWNPEYYLKRATQAGPNTVDFFKKVMESKMMIDQSYNACRGLVRLMEEYGSARMEAACRRGLKGYRFTYTAIKKILENKMDQTEENSISESRLPIHTNLRGPQAYD